MPDEKQLNAAIANFQEAAYMLIAVVGDLPRAQKHAEQTYKVAADLYRSQQERKRSEARAGITEDEFMELLGALTRKGPEVVEDWLKNHRLQIPEHLLEYTDGILDDIKVKRTAQRLKDL